LYGRCAVDVGVGSNVVGCRRYCRRNADRHYRIALATR
jgi:hypothetical protein